MQLSIPYVLEGPDGTRAVFGNSDEARADPDWLGFIDPDNRIAGLDGADVRENADDLVEEDGGIHGAFYRARRPVVINLTLDPSASSTLLELHEQRLKKASRALRDDATLRWTPTSDMIERILYLRRQAKPAFTGRRPRVAQLSMVSADARVLAAVESQQTIEPGAAAGTVGYTSPYSSPYGTTVGDLGQQFVVNEGDDETWPRFRLDGPITNPEILHNGLGKRIKLNYALETGQWLEIDPRRRSVLLNGTASRFGSVVYPDTKWWKLQDGSNDIRLLAAAYSAPAQLTIFWRHAFE